MPSGLSSPLRRTRTRTATASSTWRGRGIASLSASSCATRSGTRSTWATRSMVSSISHLIQEFILAWCWSVSVYFTAQANSTTSAINRASVKITVSSSIRSWMEEQAGTSEPTSYRPDLVNTLFHTPGRCLKNIFTAVVILEVEGECETFGDS